MSKNADKTRIILICADENVNRGERDYAIALGLQLADHHGADVISYKVGHRVVAADQTVRLALNNNEYANIPHVDIDSVINQITQVKGDVHIIGAGESTCADLIKINGLAKSQGINVKSSLITHIVTPTQEDELSQTDIHVFTPSSARELPKLDATGKLHCVSAVPHTATEENLAYHARILTEQSANGAAINKIVHGGKPFATVILNAGFDVDGQHMPYTEIEARAHGLALGRYMDNNTALILVDGGPRNLKDKELGEFTDQAFIQGYLQGQNARHATNNPVIIHEKFEPGLAYNSLYGMLHYSKQDNCRAVISNAEGYGTMDAVIQFIDNQSKLSGMFPFAANEYVPQRLENISQYNKAGIACLFNQDGDLVIKRHDNEQKTPTVRQPNPTTFILNKIGLGPDSSKAISVQKRQKLTL